MFSTVLRVGAVAALGCLVFGHHAHAGDCQPRLTVINKTAKSIKVRPLRLTFTVKKQPDRGGSVSNDKTEKDTADLDARKKTVKAGGERNWKMAKFITIDQKKKMKMKLRVWSKNAKGAFGNAQIVTLDRQRCADRFEYVHGS